MRFIWVKLLSFLFYIIPDLSTLMAPLTPPAFFFRNFYHFRIIHKAMLMPHPRHNYFIHLILIS